MTPEQRFWHTARERESIRLRKEAGLPPELWTDDPVFRSGRFCNVWRQYDKTTAAILRVLREQAEYQRLAGAVCLRMVNRYDNISQLSGRLGLRDYHALTDRGLHTRAYRINTPQGLNSFSGVRQVQARAAGSAVLLHTLQGSSRSFRELVQGVRHLLGMSEFIAYQAVLDIRDLGLIPHVADDWAYVGPGAVRGAQRLLGHDPRPAPGTVTNFCGGPAFRPDRQQEPRAHAAAILEVLAQRGEEETGQPWSVHEAEGWLCEFDKYERARLAT